MRRTQGYIPRNLGAGTIWDGRLVVRNAIEALVVVAVVYVISKVMELFLPYLIVVSIRLILWVLLGLITLHGVNGEPLSVFIMNIINYSNSRTYATLKPPQRELPPEEKTRAKEKKTSKKRNISDLIFTKGPKTHGKKK